MTARVARIPLAVGGVAVACVVQLMLLIWAGAMIRADAPAPVLHTMANTAQVPSPKSTIISTQNIPDIEGKQMTVVLLNFPPSGFSPEHHHEGSLTVYVLKGTIRSQLAGAPPQIYTAGQSFFEPIGAVHLFAENVSATEEAEVLAVFIHDRGARLTVRH